MTEDDRATLARYPGARWRDQQRCDDEHPGPPARGYVCVDVTLRRVADGAERVHIDDNGFPIGHGEGAEAAISGAVYWWTEGNGGCDCNRRMDFLRAGGERPASVGGCSTGEFAITAPSWLADEERRAAVIGPGDTSWFADLDTGSPLPPTTKAPPR